MKVKPLAIFIPTVMQIKDASEKVMSSKLFTEKQLKKAWLSWSKK